MLQLRELMASISISGTLATDESPARQCKSSFVLDVEDVVDTTQTTGTTYELVATTSNAPSARMWNIVQNTGSAEAIVRMNFDGTNYGFVPLPVGAIQILGPTMQTNALTDPNAIEEVHVRALSGSTTVKVITLYVL